MSSYGFSTNLFVSRKAESDSLVIGGTGEDASRWTRVLTQRAAQMLWFQLVQQLFPEKSGMVTGMVTTAVLRDATRPTITTHVTVDKVKDADGYTITGWVGEQNWTMKLVDYEARRFWTALDIALYPVGWKGHTSGNKVNR